MTCNDQPAAVMGLLAPYACIVDQEVQCRLLLLQYLGGFFDALHIFQIEFEGMKVKILMWS